MTTQKIYLPQFKQLLQDFTDWLQTLSYSPETIKTRHRNIYEFLLFLEHNKTTTIEQTTNHRLKHFVKYLKRRRNKVFGAGLSNSSINTAIAGVNLFFEYMQKSGKYQTSHITRLAYIENNYKSRTVLTLEEIRSLFDATYIEKDKSANPLAFGQRDRAMLAVYYGCGLRKSEGTNLQSNDILPERKLLYVRKGKGSKERYVPITGLNLQYIKEYKEYGRKWLLEQGNTGAESFFINQYGQAASGQTLTNRLESLVQETGEASITNKKPTLHSLRHSIATHLLQQGMQIEMIQKFLGHQSLESTQVYTHILNESEC